MSLSPTLRAVSYDSHIHELLAMFRCMVRLTSEIRCELHIDLLFYGKTSPSRNGNTSRDCTVCTVEERCPDVDILQESKI